MGIVELYHYFKKSSGVSIDSRSIQKGNLFFALKGPNFDGHKYVESALQSGASYAVVDDLNYANSNQTLWVPNVEKALQDLARYHRSQLTIPIIGITGSNGKTTTKELMASILATEYEVFATKGNLNNHLGVPISILSITDEHTMAIIEMGANHIGEIKFLSEISMPDMGLITNIGKAHLEGFGSIEGVRIGKTELYDYLQKVGGSIFYHAGDEMLVKSLPNDLNTTSYTISDVVKTSDYPFLEFKHEGVSIESNLSGDFNLINMIAAITVGKHFGISHENLKKGIENYVPANNRSQLKKTVKNTLILDAYNANPSSMEESIRNFYNHPGSNKTLILGHMLELGDSATVEHERLINFVASMDWNQVYLVGSEFKKMNKEISFQIFEDVKSLSDVLKEIKLQDNLILLKGSRGVALEKCVEFL